MPELISQHGDVLVSEWLDALSSRSGLRMLISHLGVLQRSPRLLVSGDMVLFPMFLRRYTMGMRGGLMQFGGSLVVLVM